MKINIAPRNKSSSVSLPLSLSLSPFPTDERGREREEARRIERYNEASKGRETGRNRRSGGCGNI